jgi:hypothetical protein
MTASTDTTKYDVAPVGNYRDALDRMAEDTQTIHQGRLIFQERLATATQQEIAN